METDRERAPEPVILIIADISGYTRYMTANAKTLAHSQTIITELVTAIVRQVEMPLEVAKLEGDAIFLYGRKLREAGAEPLLGQAIGQKLLSFFAIFREKIAELSHSTTCTCNACTQIEKLRLKLIVHSGEALFHRVLSFEELAGVDVIIVHRLLKNSVKADQYLLITETAQRDVQLPSPAKLIAGVETYEDIGGIRVGVYYPDRAATPGANITAPHSSFGDRYATAWRLWSRLWFKPLLSIGFSRAREYHHLESDVGRAAQWGFTLFTLLLTPVYLPVASLTIALKALKRPVEEAGVSATEPHEHLADGSCCKKS